MRGARNYGILTGLDPARRLMFFKILLQNQAGPATTPELAEKWECDVAVVRRLLYITQKPEFIRDNPWHTKRVGNGNRHGTYLVIEKSSDLPASRDHDNHLMADMLRVADRFRESIDWKTRYCDLSDSEKLARQAAKHLTRAFKLIERDRNVFAWDVMAA
jgi:hypothetical protein